MNPSHPANPPGPMLKAPLPGLNDPEGACVPDALPFVVDAHVHLFPDGLFSSIWEWFDCFGWPVRYKLKSPQVIEFLLSRGVKHVVGLQYAHRPGVSRELNAYMAGLCRRYPQVTGMATIFPGEEDAKAILDEAFALGLSGVKLHAHVQCFDILSEGMEGVYELCEANDKPLVMHVGREPKSEAYRCDPYLLCKASKVEQVIRNHPRLRICVPHLGADEYADYARMLGQYDTLWLDTTMVLADYLPGNQPPPLSGMRSDRILYGTDFPNIPYAWDRELRRLAGLGLPEESLAMIAGGNAVELFSIREQGGKIK